MSPGTLFEEIGFNYIGLIDGHDLNRLVEILGNLQQLPGPQLLHIVTQKGKGYVESEKDPYGMHALTKIAPTQESGTSENKSTSPAATRTETAPAQKAGTARAETAAATSSDKARAAPVVGSEKAKAAPAASSDKPEAASAPPALTYSQVFGHWLCHIAAQEPLAVGITPAMGEGSGMREFADRFPDRFHDVAIAEQHAVTFAAGMACEGLKPIVAIYSTFYAARL